MTPYEIDVLLHYHYKTEDHPDIRRLPPVWPSTIDHFLKVGLLKESTQTAWCYQITERGDCYVREGLCRVPLPTQHWKIPARDE